MIDDFALVAGVAAGVLPVCGVEKDGRSLFPLFLCRICGNSSERMWSIATREEDVCDSWVLAEGEEAG